MSDKKMDTEYLKYENDNYIKLVLKMSIPAVIALLFQALYNIIDTIFVARYDLSGVAAVSITFPIQAMALAVAMGLNVGISTNVSRKLGEYEKDIAAEYAVCGVCLGVIVSLLFCVIGMLGIRMFVDFFTNDDTIYQYGIDYGKWLVICIIALLPTQSIIGILQSCGYMKQSMVINLVGAVVNIVLDPILIWGKFGVPELGITGAALATVIGQYVSLVIAIIMIIAIKLPFRFRISELSTIEKGRIRDILESGIPTSIMTGLSSIMLIMMNKILAYYGEQFITVFGIYSKVQTLLSMPLIGIGQAVLPIISYNYGAKNNKRMKSALLTGITFAIITSLSVLLLFQFQTRNILLLFNGDEEVLYLGTYALKIISFIFPMLAVIHMCNISLQATGKAVESLKIVLLKEIILLLPISYLCFRVLGTKYGWFSYIITNIIIIVLALYKAFSNYSNIKKEMEKSGLEIDKFQCL